MLLLAQAFVTMASESEADNAVALDKHVIDGRDVKVAISVEQNAPGSAKQ